MSDCKQMQSRLSEYLDGRLTGVEMQRIASHLDSCPGCSAEWSALRQAHRSLASLGPVAPPEDLLLRIRVAVSQEQARRRQSVFQSWSLAWRNTLGPFLLQAGAGFASAVLLLGTVVVLVGIVTKPETAHAGDEPLGMATSPRLLYTLSGATDKGLNDLSSPVVVEAYINDSGQVYDYRIVSGPDDPGTRARVEDMLVTSVFAPARFFGQPVRGLAVLSFSGVSVRG